MRCARHPQVETALSCGRCETPICPRCLVMTDVGARCQTCAPRRRLPQFEVGPRYLARGVAAAAAAGAALGFLWWVVFPFRPGALGFFGLILALLLGYAVGEAVSLASNRKSGTSLQAVAAAGVIVAYVLRNLLAGEGAVPTDDLFGYVFVILAAAVAIGRLRY